LPGLEQSTYLGISVLLLAALGAYHLRRNLRRRARLVGLLLILALSLNLSLGKELTILKSPSDFKAFNHLLLLNHLDGLALFKQSRVPGRWSMTAFLMVAVLAGCGFHRLLRIRRPWLKYGASILALALVMLEFAHRPAQVSAFPHPRAYDQIGQARQPEETLVEVPLGFLDGARAYGPIREDLGRMVWATRHHYRVVSCYLSRIGDRRVRHLIDQPFLRDLWYCQGNDQGLVQGAPTPGADVEQWLRRNHVTYVMVRRAGRSDAVEPYLASTRLFNRVYLDEQYALYRFNVPKTE
jgi:hypothetical protein